MSAATPDFRLYHGNDLEILAGLLAAELAKPLAGQGLLEPDLIVIPQPAMRRWLQKILAEKYGIAANLRFLAPGEFVRQALDANVPDSCLPQLGDAATLRWRLWDLLADPACMAEAVFAPLQRVLAGPDVPLAAWSLAGELADAFEKYQAWRRDWLRRWDQGAERGDWQAELWRRSTHGLSHRARRLDQYLSRYDSASTAVPAGLPGRVFAFACQNVSPDVLRVLASSARAGALHFFFLSPVAGWWGDLVTARERLGAGADAFLADDENPLLRANGAAGRDFVRTLFSYEVVHPSYELAVYAAPDLRQHTGLLHRLQHDLLARSPPPSPSADLPCFADTMLADRSLQVHACHTRLREVQVLHDQLRALLEDDPQLQARDIAVLTPDIDQYAAHVHAVFGGQAPGLHIPYALSDGGMLGSEPLAAAFLRLLALPSASFTVTEVLELLAVPAIAQRLQLEAADFGRLADCLSAAGVRWGLDADHRHALGAPAESAYTWAWALDRLLLGHASGDSADIAGVAPWPELEGSTLILLDGLLQGLHKLAHLQRVFAGRHRAGQWQALLAQAIDSLFAEHPLDPGDRRAVEQLRALLATFARQTESAGLALELPISVVRAWFVAALGDGDARQPFLTGGVTFGRMVPMRLVPFKVICLLGMNDGEFPRRDPAGGLNRLSAELDTPRRQVGDRSIRDDDRGLFLQLLAAATQTFYLSYLGQDPRTGEAMPPSVVVAELLDVSARYFSDAGQARRELTVVHPLQPFAPEAFGRDDPRRRSYQRNWRPAVDEATAARTPLAAFAIPLPEPEAASTGHSISRDRLVRVLANPPREYLLEGLGLRLPQDREQAPEAEPFDSTDGLHRHALTQRVFAAAIGSEARDRPALYRRLLAEGLIAPGAIGEQEVSELLDQMIPIARTWRGWGGDRGVTRAYQLDLGLDCLVGRLAAVHEGGLRQFDARKDHGKSRLDLGIDALVWSALGETRPIQRLRMSGAETIAPLPAEIARDHLAQLIALANLARRIALPFMPKTGYAFASRPDEASAWSAARQQWSGRDGGDGDDAYVGLALRGVDPFRDNELHARQVFAQLSTQVFSLLPSASTTTEAP